VVVLICLLSSPNQLKKSLFSIYHLTDFFFYQKVVDTPEVLRVFVASMRDAPYQQHTSDPTTTTTTAATTMAATAAELLAISDGSGGGCGGGGGDGSGGDDGGALSVIEKSSSPQPPPPNHRLFDLEREALLVSGDLARLCVKCASESATCERGERG
jgi:hypothetical protein